MNRVVVLLELHRQAAHQTSGQSGRSRRASKKREKKARKNHKRTTLKPIPPHLVGGIGCLRGRSLLPRLLLRFRLARRQC